MSSWLESIGKMGKGSKIGLGIAAVAAVGLLYAAFRSKEGKTNDYFKVQDTGRSLTRRATLPTDLGDMMYSRNAHKGKQPPLVYGLEDESREPLRNRYKMPDGFEKRVIIPASIATAGPFTADHFNNVTWRGFTEDGKPDQSIFNKKTMTRLRSSSEGTFDSRVKDELGKWRAKLPEQYKTAAHDSFFDELTKHPRYSPATTAQAKDDDMIEREGGNDAAKAKFQSQTRKSSKFGLEHHRKKGENVAFMLDFPKYGSEPDDYAFQINKTKTGNRAGGFKSSERVPITTSEMRKAYRDKDEGGTQPTFFVGGDKVKAPWDKRKDQWDKYGDYRLKKYTEAWKKHDETELDTHTKHLDYTSLTSDNQRANYLKQKWTAAGRDIPREKNKPKLVS